MATTSVFEVGFDIVSQHSFHSSLHTGSLMETYFILGDLRTTSAHHTLLNLLVIFQFSHVVSNQFRDNRFYIHPIDSLPIFMFNKLLKLTSKDPKFPDLH